MHAETMPSFQPLLSKVRDSGIMKMRFEMSDSFIHLWVGPAEAWEAEDTLRRARLKELVGDSSPEAEAEREELQQWSALHPDLDTTLVVAVRCELKPESAAMHEKPMGWSSPSGMSVRKMRRLRALVLDAIEQSDDVSHIHMTAGGDGRCQLQIALPPDPEDKMPGRYNSMDPSMYARLTFFDDEGDAW